MSMVESPPHWKGKTGAPLGRPRGSSNPGLADRIKRWQLHEKYAALVDKYGPAFCERVMSLPAEDGKGPDGHGFAYTFDEQMQVLKLMSDRAYGRPSQAVQVGTVSNEHRILTVRWLPPDPNDKSVAIQPEPD